MVFAHLVYVEYILADSLVHVLFLLPVFFFVSSSDCTSTSIINWLRFYTAVVRTLCLVVADTGTVNYTLWSVCLVATDLLLSSPIAPVVVDRSSIHPLLQPLEPNSVGITCQLKQAPERNLVSHMFCLHLKQKKAII